MRQLRRISAILCLALFAACDELDEITPGDTYELVEAEGEPLPAVVFEGELEGFGHVVATAVSGSITLRETTYTERFVIDLTTEAGEFPGDPIVIHGDYTADGALLTFEPDREDYPSFTGTLSGAVLTTTEVHPEMGTLTLVWER